MNRKAAAFTAIALLGVCGAAFSQGTFQATTTRYQPLTYSKQGDISGCGMRIIVVGENQRAIDSSINLNFVQGIFAGLFKVGFSELNMVSGSVVEKPREVTFGKLETKRVSIDTKQGQKSDDAGYYIGAVEGLPTLQMLAEVNTGADLTFTVSVKGDGYDHRIVTRQKPSLDEIHTLQDCLKRLMEKAEKGK
jgi:hypothetical protein